MNRLYLKKLASEFFYFETELTWNRYNEIKEKDRQLSKMVESGKIGEGMANKIQNKILNEIRNSCVKFNNEKDYLIFSIYLSKLIKKGEKFAREIVKHELEHAKVWNKYGIKTQLGWMKAKDGATKRCYTAFCQPNAKQIDKMSRTEAYKINYESLKAVSEPSPSDIEEIKYFEERYGNKIK